MIKAIITILGIFSFLSYSVHAQVHIMDTACTIQDVTNFIEKDDWQTVKQSEGITIKYRWLKLEKSKTRELITHFTVDSHPDSVLAYLKVPEKHMLWNKGVKYMHVLEQDSIHWISHSMYNIPFPISQQDLVVKNVIIRTEDTIIVNITSKPNFIPPVEDIERVKRYIAQWVITPLEDQKVDVTYSAITPSKSYIPRFIKDPIVQNNLLKSFKSLKQNLNSK